MKRLDALQTIVESLDRAEAQSVYVGSVPTGDSLPGFAAANPFPLFEEIRDQALRVELEAGDVLSLPKLVAHRPAVDPEVMKRRDFASRHREVPRRRSWRSREQKPRFLLEARWAGQEPGSSASKWSGGLIGP